MIAGSPNERADAWEHAREMDALGPACLAEGIQLEELVWNAPDWDPADFEAFVIGTTWDYQEHAEHFLSRLQELQDQAPLLNPLSTVRWNLDKRYLADMEERGITIVPTQWCERFDDAALAAARANWPGEAVVAKPLVGAGAWRQAKISRDEALPEPELLPLGKAMVQPFLPAAQSEGELSFLFFDRHFSHCLQKRAQAGDYRVQAIYGGTEKVYTPSTEELSIAQRAIDAISGDLLYARVDLMRLPSGTLALMELELIEPYFYPEQGPNCGILFAAGLRHRIARA
ncbi:MAG: hypothetical protein MK209_08950 [Planctomycetes bacterium]|nr:hypothetical protein [Planctomycetota bacterium]